MLAHLGLSATAVLLSFLLRNTITPAPTPPLLCHVQIQVLVEAIAPLCWTAN